VDDGVTTAAERAGDDTVSPMSSSAVAARTQVTLLFVTHSIDEAVLLGDRVVVLAGRLVTRRLAAWMINSPRRRTRTPW
jgi:ABC-type nitrate/sulfonate/bicarbonate transport system ATPase subunit